MKNVSRIAVVILAAGLAGCSSPSPQQSASESPSTVSATTASPTTAAPTPTSATPTAEAKLEGFDISERQSEGFPALDGTMVEIASSRVAAHDGFDRVVVEYKGAGNLGWHAGWDAQAITDGRGEAVDMPGKRFLEVTVANVNIPTDLTDLPEIQPANLGGAKAVAGVQVDFPFEGMHMLHIGADKDRPFRVQVLQNPTRLVVDIANE
ncbi:hypothetical protein [Actinobaculum massiliense]|uniref:AMIN-like domain-containing protein n=1 Tax=Actinobaculum massiliense ACS-171-V-Col2 TaxID=883066 RepID=K9EU61_9ACTO|nr:hypothetical protein [Actinobaculum massiliense]EKU94502.1 hypothetical protein HMPREF9233_01449 [Actinobaculum massiliense ACS-171-V-Col2]MDK8319582.1 hypothetical protein [Actinobaculum massiliense]MDK8567430.1 hypothetical protein [Actinobaculum massiliense]